MDQPAFPTFCNFSVSWLCSNSSRSSLSLPFFLENVQSPLHTSQWGSALSPTVSGYRVKSVFTALANVWLCSSLRSVLHEEIRAENWCTQLSKKRPLVFSPVGEIVRERAVEKSGGGAYHAGLWWAQAKSWGFYFRCLKEVEVFKWGVWAMPSTK